MPDTPRPLLVISHPGHELRVFGWVKRFRPRVLILTDGSGSRGVSRIETSRRLLADLGAAVCEPQARMRDVEAYEAMMTGDVERFVELARAVHRELRAGPCDQVAGDAREGYNPMHDVCRAIIDAAVGRRAGEGVNVASHDFSLVAALPSGSNRPSDDGLTVRLDDHELAEKLRAAGAYAELEAEVATQRAEHGDEAFRWEWLRLCGDVVAFEEPPFYERFGEGRVREGRYTQVLRYRTHVRPIEEALRVWSSEARVG